MNQYSENEKLNLFKNLFKGREDVFAVRWKKPARSPGGGNKSGYMSVYHYDPYMYQLHKMKGGTFKDYKDKTYLPLTDQQLLKHFNGEQLIGIYPLLQDNTSWFIAADFDKEKSASAKATQRRSWAEECRIFLNICKEQDIPAYLERSRSGKGGHVWVFFDKPYPAIKSRKILITLLERIGIFSVFDKGSSLTGFFPIRIFIREKDWVI